MTKTKKKKTAAKPAKAKLKQTKRKFVIAYKDAGNCDMLDVEKNKIRTVTLAASKTDEQWSDNWKGVELMRLVDDGNGFTIDWDKGQSLRLDYGDSADLFLLLKHIDETSNWTCKYEKIEQKITKR